MSKLAIVVVVASGCHWVDTLKSPPPKQENPLRADAHAEFVVGSFHFEEDGGPTLKGEQWDNVPEAWSASAEEFKLTGPDGVHRVGWHGGVAWDLSWPAGKYTIAFFAFGKNIGEAQFTVAMPPTGRGNPYPTIVSSERHAIARQDGELYSYLPTNAAMPTYGVQYIWMKDHRVVHTGRRSISNPSLIEMSQLGKFVRVDISTKEVSALGSATLMVFVNGTGLYGAWSWTKDQQVPARSLPAATPSSGDLAIARAAARQVAAEYVVHAEPIGGSHAESLACAIASDEKVREVFAGYQDDAVNTDIDDQGADEKLNRVANDDGLTERQRARMRRDAALQREEASSLADSGEKGLAQAIQLSRKYKKGCLAAMGVPTMPVLATR